MSHGVTRSDYELVQKNLSLKKLLNLSLRSRLVNTLFPGICKLGGGAGRLSSYAADDAFHVQYKSAAR